jgi:hypothetical protein
MVAPVPDCPNCERAQLITDEMRDAVALALAAKVNGPASDGRGWFRNEDQVTEIYEQADAALAALDLPGLLARRIVDVLDDVEAGLILRHNTTPGGRLTTQARECMEIAEKVRQLAAEYRAGTR